MTSKSSTSDVIANVVDGLLENNKYGNLIPRESPRRLLARLLRRAPDAAARAAPRPDWAPAPVGEDAPDEQLRHLQRLLAVLGSSSAYFQACGLL